MPSAASSPKLTVVIPAYNEAGSLAHTILHLRHELTERLHGPVELVVVDDGSADETAQVARDAEADQVLVHPTNRGKGAAVRTGVLAATAEICVFTDADLAYSADQVHAVYLAVLESMSLVIGSRSHPDSEAIVETSRMRELGSQVVNLLTRAVLSGGYRDTQSGLKGFPTEIGQRLLKAARVEGMGFDIELLHRAERSGVAVIEIPVRVTNSDTSSVNVVRDGIRLVYDIARIRMRGSRQ